MKQTKIRNTTRKSVASSKQTALSFSTRARDTEKENDARASEVPRAEPVSVPPSSSQQIDETPEALHPVLQTTSTNAASQRFTNHSSDQPSIQGFFETNISKSRLRQGQPAVFCETNSRKSPPPQGQSAATEPWYIRNRRQEVRNDPPVTRQISQSPRPSCSSQMVQNQEQQSQEQNFWGRYGGSQMDHQGRPSERSFTANSSQTPPSGPVPGRAHRMVQGQVSQRIAETTSARTQPSSNTPKRYQGHAGAGASRSPPSAGNAESPRPVASKNSASKQERSSSWRHEKRQQEKSQARAFTAKKANPFASYKHDPNDAEGFLENLSSANKESSIIPRRELEALQQRSARQRPLGLIPKKFGRNHRKGRNNNRAFPSQRVPERELMQLKAAEAQSIGHAHASSHTPAMRNISPIPRPSFASATQSVTPGNFSIVTDCEQQFHNRGSGNPASMMNIGQPPHQYHHQPPPPQEFPFSHYHDEPMQQDKDLGDDWHGDGPWDQTQQHYDEAGFEVAPWEQSQVQDQSYAYDQPAAVAHSMHDPSMMPGRFSFHERAQYTDYDPELSMPPYEEEYHDEYQAITPPLASYGGGPMDFRQPPRDAGHGLSSLDMRASRQQSIAAQAAVPMYSQRFNNNMQQQQAPCPQDPLWQQHSLPSSHTGGNPNFDSAFF